jgi:threonine/homoserine/homoserine lactone efflux protein
MFSTEFLITSLVVVLVPGTGVIYTVSTGLFMGRRASIAAACGCTAGIIPHLTASILGLSAILHMSSVAFQSIKNAGAIYLLYLAWSMWRETGALKFNSPAAKKNARHIALRGFLLNILNPKLSIFFLAFLPLFVAPDTASPLLEMVFMSVAFMAMTLIIFILYGLAAHSVSRQLASAPKGLVWLQRSFAAAFAALGVKLAMTDQ